MKNVFILMLCLALMVLGVQAGAFAQEEMIDVQAVPGEKLGFALLHNLYEAGGNTVISPLSLMLALNLAAEGAEGETLQQIMDALDADAPAFMVPDEIKAANAAFANPQLPVKEAYAQLLSDEYLAQWFEIEGDVVERVNAWVEENTDGLIDTLLTQKPDANTGMILINAVAMDARWEQPFKPYHTAEDVFRGPAGDVPVEMMFQEGSFHYSGKDGHQIVCLPYENSTLKMWIALPAEGGMDALLEKLEEQGMGYLKDGAEDTQVNLSIPKLDLTDDHDLKEALYALGIRDAFSEAADFSGISDVQLYIDAVLQKTRVQLDEEGTRAAAATAVIMPMMAMPPAEIKPVEMRVDRPFVLVVADEETGSVCFAGVVENPTE